MWTDVLLSPRMMFRTGLAEFQAHPVINSFGSCLPMWPHQERGSQETGDTLPDGHTKGHQTGEALRFERQHAEVRGAVRGRSESSPARLLHQPHGHWDTKEGQTHAGLTPSEAEPHPLATRHPQQDVSSVVLWDLLSMVT